MFTLHLFSLPRLCLRNQGDSSQNETDPQGPDLSARDLISLHLGVLVWGGSGSRRGAPAPRGAGERAWPTAALGVGCFSPSPDPPLPFSRPTPCSSVGPASWPGPERAGSGQRQHAFFLRVRTRDGQGSRLHEVRCSGGGAGGIGRVPSIVGGRKGSPVSAWPMGHIGLPKGVP